MDNPTTRTNGDRDLQMQSNRESSRATGMADPILIMQSSLFEHGQHRALKSGSLEAKEEDRAALEEHARAIATETYRDPFDPARHPHDEARYSEYQKKIADRKEAEDAAKYAAENLRDKDEDAARKNVGSGRPEASIWLLSAGVIVTAITVAPTLHDFIFLNWTDDLLAWSASLGCGAFFGILLTWAILVAADLSGQRSSTNWVGLIAGTIISVGLFALRLSGAEGSTEIVFAVGLSLVEVGVILIMEWVAQGLRVAKSDWAARQVTAKEAAGVRDVARGELARRRQRVEEIESEIKAFLAYVEDRSNRNLNVADIETSAVKSVVDGYNDGLAANRGRVRGVRGS